MIPKQQTSQEHSRFDLQECTAPGRSSAVLGLTTGCEVTARTHIVAFDLLSGSGTDITVGNSDGVVTVHKTANYRLNLTGWANSRMALKVIFRYPETRPELVALATTTVPPVQEICLLNGVSTTLSLREGETIQLVIESQAPFVIGEGLRWEINQD